MPSWTTFVAQQFSDPIRRGTADVAANILAPIQIEMEFRSETTGWA